MARRFDLDGTGRQGTQSSDSVGKEGFSAADSAVDGGFAADWDIVTGVGLTALGVAAGRAMETHSEGALVSDPFAEAFVRAAAPPKPMPTRLEDVGDDEDQVMSWTSMATYMGVRSRYFDERLAAAAEAGASQIVLLAAGLDARAYRMSWPESVTVFELDAPKVLAFKDAVLAGRGVRAGAQRRTVAVDLRNEWTGALRQAGFDPARPSAWLAEGLMMFLPNAAKERLLRIVGDLTVPGSSLEVEYVEGMAAIRRDPQFQRRRAQMSERMGLDVTDLWPDEPDFPLGDWLREHGWTVSTDYVVDVTGRYGRRLEDESMFPPRSGAFVSARK
ncbi:SAM-dependent methyltransferase [Speluncibacter jeojiensis]|uniref:SAM-dependent methyltransferase n=1 Tax=Speluncibacter jeojiensis TaxID=2710754 RepID=UPI00240EE4B7|nr:SAM-dependent methyltransferase [Rhodococcus sp. D2-41]